MRFIFCFAALCASTIWADEAPRIRCEAEGRVFQIAEVGEEIVFTLDEKAAEGSYLASVIKTADSKPYRLTVSIPRRHPSFGDEEFESNPACRVSALSPLLFFCASTAKTPVSRVRELVEKGKPEPDPVDLKASGFSASSALLTIEEILDPKTDADAVQTVKNSSVRFTLSMYGRDWLDADGEGVQPTGMVEFKQSECKAEASKTAKPAVPPPVEDSDEDDLDDAFGGDEVSP